MDVPPGASSPSSSSSSVRNKSTTLKSSSIRKDSVAEDDEEVKDEEIADIMKKVRAMNQPESNQTETGISMAVRNEFVRLSSVLGIEHNLSLEPSPSELMRFLQSSVQKVEGLKYFATHQSSSLHQGNDEDFPDDDQHAYQHGRDTQQASSSSSARLREQIRQQKDKEQKLLKQTVQLEESLKNSLNNVKEKSDWQEKYKKLMNKFRREKEEKAAYEDFIKVQNKKMKVLVQHVDKLMKALKIENSKHLKAIHDYGMLKREQERTKMQMEKQTRINNAQHRYVLLCT